MAKITLFAASIFALVLIFFFNPATPTNIYPPCPFYHLSGLYCPGCGSLRAIHQLLHGNFILALHFNPLTMLLLVIFSGYGVSCAISRKPMNSVFIRPVWIWSLLAFIVLFWILRNIPCYPFSLLAPV